MGKSSDNTWQEWLVEVPEYNHNGVVIERFTVKEDEAEFSKLRALLNPQRSDRSLEAGTFTRLTVDGLLWMTDTPAEVADLWEVDGALNRLWNTRSPASILIVGLGLGVVLNRAIRTGHVQRIDVVEWDRRIIDAVGGHYQALADERGVSLNVHHANIHEWRSPVGRYWDIGWFDIWANIDMDDLPEVTRLRNRFRKRMDWFGAWAQDERIAQKKRIRTGRYLY